MTFEEEDKVAFEKARVAIESDSWCFSDEVRPLLGQIARLRRHVRALEAAAREVLDDAGGLCDALDCTTSGARSDFRASSSHLRSLLSPETPSEG